MITDKTNLEVANDVFFSVIENYAHFNNEEVHPIGEYGNFFNVVLAEPSKYIVEQPELRERLEILRSKGMHLFLGTNSHQEYMNLIMKSTLGDGWEQIFDLNVANCRKPLFFRSTDNPMFCIDLS